MRSNSNRGHTDAIYILALNVYAPWQLVRNLEKNHAIDELLD